MEMLHCIALIYVELALEERIEINFIRLSKWGRVCGSAKNFFTNSLSSQCE